MEKLDVRFGLRFFANACSQFFIVVAKTEDKNDFIGSRFLIDSVITHGLVSKNGHWFTGRRYFLITART